MAGSIGLGLEVDVTSLVAARDQVVRTGLRAGKDTLEWTARGIERELEDITRSAVGGRLWRAWGSEVFPKGNRIAREPVATVFVKGGARSSGAMRFFSGPGRIRGKDGGPIAIPTAAAGARGRDRNLTPEEWERRHGVKLRPVYRKGRAPLLVLDQAVLSGRKQVARPNTARRRARGRGDATVAIFVILPDVAFANRYAIEPVIRQWTGQMGENYASRLRGG